MEEEIDLREYINVIVRRWKWILGITLVAVAAAATVSFFLLAPVYEVKAGVVIVKSRSEIVFEPKYRTLTEEELGSLAIDINARRKALEALVRSSSVAAEVIAKLGSVLEPEEQDVNVLLEMVVTESNGDLIGIKVKGEDPRKITAIANAWSEAYEEYANGLYGGRPQSPENIQAQVIEAESGYKKAEEVLAKLMGDNQIDTLTQEVKSKQNTLADYYSTKQGLDRLIADAKALRDQLRQGTASSPTGTGNTLSIMLLQASAFTLLSPELPVQLQLAFDERAGLEASAEDQVQDLNALLSILEARREEVQALIDEMTLQQEILQLQEQLEREQARKQELTRARDLAWETYNTLARKEAEVGVASQVTDTEVRFAVPAVEPKKPVGPKKKLNIAIAGVLGLMVGVFGAFAIEYFEGGDRESRSGN
ncbi:MAG: Wzz/FepE/Etk N-terminal domain-containing protein [Anaerolineae bacterium]